MGARERKHPSSNHIRLFLWVIIPKRGMGGPKMPLDFTSSEGTKNCMNTLGSHTRRKMISLKFRFQLADDLCILAFPAPHMVPASKAASSNYLQNELIWVTNKFEASNKATALMSCRHHWMWLAFNGPNLILVENVLKEREMMNTSWWNKFAPSFPEMASSLGSSFDLAALRGKFEWSQVCWGWGMVGGSRAWPQKMGMTRDPDQRTNAHLCGKQRGEENTEDVLNLIFFTVK